MAFAIQITPTGQQTLSALRGRSRAAWKQKLKQLETQGCAAAAYRLTGPVIERICCIHLYGSCRALVCFPSANEVVVLLVAEHRESRALDVYRLLYSLLDLEEPTGSRDKPACCDDDGDPPVDPDLVDRFMQGADALRADIAREQRKRSSRQRASSRRRSR